ncbi:hypothetical protein CYMTET_14340 [Cymbomonas tetramitiformis]|uniref:Uncharacterized protein n=1 Tax=Cymbomonas tetramitiformis TaxID=36881 RepID=A0AAE0GGA1_9CHLO|nr:hypothetical protein CYMTET_14340 [Cymbomonas tetramitiformis]
MSEKLRSGPRGDYGQPLEKDASTQTDISGVHSLLEDRRAVRDWTHPVFVPCSCRFDCRYWDPQFPYPGYVFPRQGYRSQEDKEAAARFFPPLPTHANR